MSRPKGFIGTACSGLTMVACNGEVLPLAPVFPLVNERRDFCVMIVPPSALCLLATASIVPDRIDLDGHLNKWRQSAGLHPVTYQDSRGPVTKRMRRSIGIRRNDGIEKDATNKSVVSRGIR